MIITPVSLFNEPATRGARLERRSTRSPRAMPAAGRGIVAGDRISGKAAGRVRGTVLFTKSSSRHARLSHFSLNFAREAPIAISVKIGVNPAEFDRCAAASRSFFIRCIDEILALDNSLFQQRMESAAHADQAPIALRHRSFVGTP